MADIGELVVRIGADAGELHREFSRLGKKGQDFGDQVASAGKIAAIGLTAIATAAAGASAAILGTVKATADAGDELFILSEKTGVSVEELSTMTRTAEINNVEISSLQRAYKELAGNMFEASQETKKADEFQRLFGTSATTTSGALKPTSEVLLAIADRFKNMSSATERAALANIAFGKAGQDLLPLLVQGSAAIRAQMEEVQRLGGAWSTDAAVAANEFNDNLTRLDIVMKGVRDTIGAALMPAVNALIVQFLDWFKANQAIIALQLQRWAGDVAVAISSAAQTAADLAHGLHSIATETSVLSPLFDVLMGGLKGLGFVITAVIKAGRIMMDVMVALFLGIELAVVSVLARIPVLSKTFTRLKNDIKIQMEAVKDVTIENANTLLAELGLIEQQGQTERIRRYDAHITEYQSHIKTANTGTLNLEIAGMKARNQAFGEMIDFQNKRQAFEEAHPQGAPSPGGPFQEGLGRGIVQSAIAARNAERQAINESLADQVRRADTVMALQDQIFQSSVATIDGTEVVRRAAFAKIQADFEQRKALVEQEVLDRERAIEMITDLELRAEAQRMAAVRQFPTFWEKQLQDVVNSNAFSVAQIVTTWTSGIANSIVKGGDFVKQAWEATQIFVVQAALNTGVQLAAQWALQASVEMGILTATEAAKLGLKTTSEAAQTAVKIAGDTARVTSNELANAEMTASDAAAAAGSVGIWAGAQATIIAALTATGVAIKAFWVETILPALIAIGTAFLDFLTAIGTALGFTGIGAPLAGAILVGAAIIAVALISLKAIKLAEGGIVTGPTLAMVGEAGPEAVIPLKGRHGLGMGRQEVTIVHTHVMLDGREIATATARHLPRAFRLSGVPA